MTPQEIFDTVATHLFTQGVMAVNTSLIPDSDGTAKCAYRGDNGVKCAAGCLIPDELYKPEMENKRFFAFFDYGGADLTQNRFDLPEWMRQNIHLIGALQCIHDNAKNWKNTECMRKMLRRVGYENGVSTDILKTLSFKGR